MWAQYRFFRIAAGIEAPRLFDSLPYIRQAGWESRNDKLDQKRALTLIACCQEISEFF
jgi:hypothetical protein